MSGSLHDWYSQRDLESLAERERVLSGELQLSKLTRLVGMLNSDAGSVRASLKFGQRRGGVREVELTYTATVEPKCQRCLEPFCYEFADRVNLVLVEAGSKLDAVPEGYEPFELSDGRLLPAELIEDELIVSMPLAPKHGRLEDCGSVARNLIAATDVSDAATGAAEQ
ncbi:MAG: YceD family protein [Gammaproteobacteria bacterium]